MSDQKIGPVEFVRHVHAINRTLASGFTFEFERDNDGVATALHGIRYCRDVVDTYTIHGSDEAVAARYRHDAPAGAVPLWKRVGGVVEVLDDIRALPEPDDRQVSR